MTIARRILAKAAKTSAGQTQSFEKLTLGQGFKHRGMIKRALVQRQLGQPLPQGVTLGGKAVYFGGKPRPPSKLLDPDYHGPRLPVTIKERRKLVQRAAARAPSPFITPQGAAVPRFSQTPIRTPVTASQYRGVITKFVPGVSQGVPAGRSPAINVMDDIPSAFVLQGGSPGFYRPRREARPMKVTEPGYTGIWTRYIPNISKPVRTASRTTPDFPTRERRR